MYLSLALVLSRIAIVLRLECDRIILIPSFVSVSAVLLASVMNLTDHFQAAIVHQTGERWVPRGMRHHMKVFQNVDRKTIFPHLVTYLGNSCQLFRIMRQTIFA